MSVYRQLTLSNAGASEQAVLALWGALQAGGITRAEFIAAASTALAVSIARSVSLADLGLATTLTELTGQPALPIGLALDDPSGRLQQAFSTLLDRADEPGTDGAAMVSRIARAEPLRAGQLAYAEGMRQRQVYGWTRVTDASPCAFCARLVGPVLPASVTMIHHPGCSCSQQPVLLQPVLS